MLTAQQPPANRLNHLHPDTDAETALLIAQLLEEDLTLLESTRVAESFQIRQAINDSVLSDGIYLDSPMEDDVDSEQNALRMMAQSAREEADWEMAKILQSRNDKDTIAGQQFAMKMAAEHRKLTLDTEFARTLQARFNESADMDDDEEDDADMRDVENVLDKDTIARIMAADINEKGKGKASQVEEPSQNRTRRPRLDTVAPLSYPICGICQEQFHATSNPLLTSTNLTTSSAERLQFGLVLPCPKNHAYCLNCMTSYLRSKLEDGDAGKTVFPVRCPECKVEEWQMSDGEAEKILGTDDMVKWHHQKLLDSIPKYYCPNPRCSAHVQLHDDPNVPQAQCPACQIIMCVPCKSLWHKDLTCEQYQALPLDERSPEDQLVLQLAKAKKWRRCPKCAVIVELASGCHHVTCTCGAHFCHNCGADWDLKITRCTRNPPCELWEEDRLLEEAERERVARADYHERRRVDEIGQGEEDDARALMEHARNVFAQAMQDREEREAQMQDRPPVHYDEFEWMDDPNVVGARHEFTRTMLHTLTCGYCNARLNSLADLRYHLSHVTRHPVYACCGRFFKRDVDFERHVDAGVRWGRHDHQVRRD